MNPQDKWLEINKEVVESLWDTMTDYFKQVVAHDADHDTKIFYNFHNFIVSETERKFRQWETAHHDYFPTTAESWLNQTDPIIT